MICPDCDSWIVDGAMFCTVCGTRVRIEKSAETQPGGSACTSCGAALILNTSFCTSCGSAKNATPGADVTLPKVDVADTMLRPATPTPAATPVPDQPMFVPGRRRNRKVMSSILIGLGVFILVAAAFVGGYLLIEFLVGSPKAVS